MIALPSLTVVWMMTLLTGCTQVGVGKGVVGPSIEAVDIQPKAPRVDEKVTCTADTDASDVEFHWFNGSREIGKGANLRLTPALITPGETLRCEVTARKGLGSRTASAHVKPVCGFSDAASMADVNVTIHIFFRPYITDDLIPGYEGEPWDWDGSIPGWISDVVDALDEILGTVSSIYPDPDLVAMAEAASEVNEILDLIDAYGPQLMEGTVPPDPNVFPYLVDSDENILPLSDAGLSWDDSYEVSFNLNHLDLRRMVAVGVDMEDLDAAFDDNMGDYLDQDSVPLVLSPSLLGDNAYCTATYYNPSSKTQESDVAVVPSSILWMSIEVQ